MQQRARPTIIDVARLAGVSPTTVSYVLSGSRERSARISEATTARVMDAVAEIGYVPNASARTLRLQRTNRVLFLGTRLSSLYSQEIANSVGPELARHGLSLSVQVGSEPEDIQRAIAILDQKQADGLIAETDDTAVPELRLAAARGHAIVAIGPSTREPAFDVMSNDDAPAIQAAMLHVAERSDRRFVLFSSLPDVLQEHRVRVAYQDLISLGIAESEIVALHCPHDRIRAHHVALDLLPRLSRPVAVYAGADVSAIGVLWACLRLGLRVPDDVAIIGHGNSPEMAITSPPLTSLGPIHSDFARAATLMASRLHEPSVPGRHLIEPCQLSIRAST